MVGGSRWMRRGLQRLQPRHSAGMRMSISTTSGGTTGSARPPGARRRPRPPPRPRRPAPAASGCPAGPGVWSSTRKTRIMALPHRETWWESRMPAGWRGSSDAPPAGPGRRRSAHGRRPGPAGHGNRSRAAARRAVDVQPPAVAVEAFAGSLQALPAIAAPAPRRSSSGRQVHRAAFDPVIELQDRGRRGVRHRDDFLGAAQRHVRAFGVLEQEAGRHAHVDAQPRHAVVGQRQQGRGQVDRRRRAQRLTASRTSLSSSRASVCAWLMHAARRASTRWPATSRLRLSAVRWWPSRSCSSREMRVRSLTRALWPATRGWRAVPAFSRRWSLARLRLLPRDQAGDEHEHGEPGAEHRLQDRLGQPNCCPNTKIGASANWLATSSAMPIPAGNSHGSTHAATISRMLPRPLRL